MQSTPPHSSQLILQRVEAAVARLVERGHSKDEARARVVQELRNRNIGLSQTARGGISNKDEDEDESDGTDDEDSTSDEDDTDVDDSSDERAVSLVRLNAYGISVNNN